MTAISPIKSVAIWGLGNVGTGFALALKALPISLHLYSTSEHSRRRAQSSGLNVEDSLAAWEANVVESADLVALGWSDDALPHAQNATLSALEPAQTLIHFSGALNASELQIGHCEKASLHPLAACPSPQRAARTFSHGPLVLEGSDIACERLTSLLKPLGTTVHRMQQGQKTSYHAGAVLASNALVGLLHAARSQWHQAGLQDTEHQLLLSLASSALDAIHEQGLVDGLTGPLMRGDVGTIERHLNVLDEQAQTLYRSLSRELLELLGQDYFEAQVYETLWRLLNK